MAISTISSKGQITLPASARRKLGIRAHDRVTVETRDDAIVIRRIKNFFELEGFLGEGLPLKEVRKRMIAAVAARAMGGRS